ncbi:hypothetical protein D3C81_1915830 [compost metagenome]
MAQSQFKFLCVHQIGNTDTVASSLIHISRANALAGGTDLVRTLAVFFQSIQNHMIRHNDMGAIADHQIFGVEAVLMNIINFLDQGFRINNHSVPDDTDLFFIKYT